MIFQSTLPAREATFLLRWCIIIHVNFNPRFPRGKRRQKSGLYCRSFFISIHASREGSDGRSQRHKRIYFHFNPRFPRGKRHVPVDSLLTKDKFQSTLPAREATSFFNSSFVVLIFQSTLPAREATGAGHFKTVRENNFNPRFPRGKRPLRHTFATLLLSISIHASREGSDVVFGDDTVKRQFQSTLPAREAT